MYHKDKSLNCTDGRLDEGNGWPSVAGEDLVMSGGKEEFASNVRY